MSNMRGTLMSALCKRKSPADLVISLQIMMGVASEIGGWVGDEAAGILHGDRHY